MSNTLPYTTELLTIMNDPKARREKAFQMLSSIATECKQYGGFDMKPSVVFNTCNAGRSSHITCVFGTFNGSWRVYDGKPMRHRNDTELRYYGNFGIEILGAEPNATGRTYSRKCIITIKELKEACKMNKIKITGMDKKALLHALMKI